MNFKVPGDVCCTRSTELVHEISMNVKLRGRVGSPHRRENEESERKLARVLWTEVLSSFDSQLTQGPMII